MPAKAPMYLKQNGKNGQSGGKGAKKLRDILSTEMISPPLGDFRHMAHVGRGGKDDMFGDTTFLKNKNSNGTTANSKGIPAFHSFRRKGTGKSLKKYRNSSVTDGEHSDERPGFKRIENGYGLLESPILQTAVSLPMLNQDQASGPTTPTHDGAKENGKKTENNNSIPAGTISEDHLNGPPKPRRITNDENAISNGHVLESKKEQNRVPVAFSDTTSIDESWSLELDLGTSLMDDVMGIMDKIEL